MRITFISDTHTRQMLLNGDLPGGDLIVHTGDIMNSGYGIRDVMDFCEWYAKDDVDYDHKIFIAGNHDRMFENNPEHALEVVNKYPWIEYLQDSESIVEVEGHRPVKVYGSPWQPEFYNWAFNLPRNGNELASVWEKIPEDVDILLTHGPAFGFLDTVQGRRHEHLGCELLAERIKAIKPKIHVCGHIHTGHGYYFDGHTHFINASILDERYDYSHKPLTADWDPETNELKFV